MGTATSFRRATACAAALLLVGGIARPLAVYLRFHHAGGATPVVLEFVAIATVFTGTLFLVFASLALPRGKARSGVTTPRFWLALVAATVVFGAAGVLLGLGFQRIHELLAGEARLWFDMGVHTPPLFAAAAAAWLSMRGPPRPARA